ncbi:MAG: hypothetical protein AB7U75_07800 [Hyphomicrobiaceae bacterium]
MSRSRYVPPKQSAIGQFFDSLLLLALVFVALFLPLHLKLASGGKTDLNFPEKTWSAMGQNETMAHGWEKLGMSAEQASTIIASRFDYTFSLLGFIVTALVVVAYFYIVVHYSKIEYKEVISERFGDRGGSR